MKIFLFINICKKLFTFFKKFFVADAYNNRVLRFSNSVSFSPDLKMGEARLDYLRGDRTNEGDKGYKFRERESLLGDIVGSEAVFVGHLDRKWPSGSGFPTGKNKYSKFAIGNKTRREVVYVGANDGMLHAFDANTGEELLAYLPGNLFTNKSHEGYHYQQSFQIRQELANRIGGRPGRGGTRDFCARRYGS